MDPKKFDALLRQYSIPLIMGIFAGIIFANASPSNYEYIFGTDKNENHFEILNVELFGYQITTFSFLINDCFMVFFFGFACKGIIESVLPKGSMYPLSRAITPIVSCICGIMTPIIIYILLVTIIYKTNTTYLSNDYSYSTILNGWGIPTATDISLAWVVASFVFINNTNNDTDDDDNSKIHPCISFLLILAIVDDGIGLIIIAIFYPDPDFKLEPIWLLLVIGAMIIAYLSRRYLKIYYCLYYIVIVGGISWIGLLKSRIHPSLCLIPIMPFMIINNNDLSMLNKYDKYFQVFVQYGLFFFTFCNAGVEFSEIGFITLTIFCSILFGKCIGIYLSTFIVTKYLRFGIPNGMNIKKDLLLLSFVGSVSLTVSIFVANVAFTDKKLRQEAKMGALISATVVMISCILYRYLFIEKDITDKKQQDEEELELQT